MKRRHLWMVALSLIIAVCMCFGLAACDSCGDDKDNKDNDNTGNTPTTPVTLAVPTLSLDEDTGVVTWNAVANASSYKYKIDDGAEITPVDRSVTLSDGETVKVKSVGDGTNYTDSAYSEPVTYTAKTSDEPATLAKPVVTVTPEGVASWNAVTGAVKYAYQIKDADGDWGTAQETEDLTVSGLTDGQIIRVKALGDGTDYEAESAWSAEKTCHADGTVDPEPLEKPIVEVTKEGVASWNTVTGAVKYAYQIKDADGDWGTTQETEDLTVDGLTAGQIIRVKALGDGTEYAAESEWSTEVACPEAETPEPVVLPETDFPVTSIPDLTASVPNAGNTTTEKSYAIGQVKSVKDAYNSEIYIVDEDDNELYVYGLRNEDGSTVLQTPSTLFAVGDAIVVYGVMTNYGGTIEMQYAWLVQINDDAKTDVAEVLLADLTGVPASAIGDFDLPTADGKISWEVTEGTAITIEEGSNHATVTRESTNQNVVLTATADVDGVIASKTFTVKVKAAVAEGVGLIFDFTTTGSTQKGSTLNASSALDFINSAANIDSNLVSVSVTNVYAGNGTGGGTYENDPNLLKMGTSSKNGVLVLTFSKAVSKITINSVAWPNVSDTVGVNDETAKTMDNDKKDYVFELTDPSEVVTITTTKRAMIFTISVEFEATAIEQAPEVDIDLDGLATWKAVPHAEKYVYKINDGEEQETTNLSVQLNDGDKIVVKAVAEGLEDGPWSTAATYNMVMVDLGTPDVSINAAGEARWATVDNAEKYVYQIKEKDSVAWGEETETTSLKVDLEDGQSIQVKAVGKANSRFNDSPYSAEKKYTKPVTAQPHNDPVVTVAIDGTVTITQADADSFSYKIGDGEEKTIDNGDEGSVSLPVADKLTDGQSITVKAIGDGTIYTDSGEVTVTFKAPLTFDKPEDFTFEMDTANEGSVLIKWTAPDHADANTTYTVIIDDNNFDANSDAQYSFEFKKYTSIKVKVNANGVTEPNGADYSVIIYESDEADATEAFLTFYEANKPVVTEVEFNFVGAYDNSAAVPTQQKDGVTLTFDKGTHSSNPTYYNTGTAVRFYAGNTLTVSAEQTIKKIVFASENYLLVATPSTGAFVDASTWKGGSNKVVFTTAAYDGQNHSRISTMTVYFGEPDDNDKVEVALAALPDIKGEHNENFEVVTVSNGLEVTWTTPVVSGDGSISITGTTATVSRGENEDTVVTVTASVSSGDVTKTREFEVTIKQQPGEGVKEEVKLYTLIQTTGSNSGYANNCDVTLADSSVWNVEGNAQMNPWRFGGGTTVNKTDRTLTGKTAITGKVTKMYITLTDGGGITVNSITLNVYKDDPTTGTVAYTQNIAYKKGEQITVTAGEGEDWSNCYYQIVFNLTHAANSGNKYVAISALEFYGYAAQ